MPVQISSTIILQVNLSILPIDLFRPAPRSTKRENPWWHPRFLEVSIIALAYILCARLGQSLAIEPGNITPVWIPSGIMLALALKFGPRIWPGIFIGALAGNMWAYFSLESFAIAAKAILAGTCNGIGDVICAVVMANLIIRFGKTNYPFNSLSKYYSYLIFGVIAGPIISAFFGVGSLWSLGFIETNNFSNSLATWFIGDSVGALLFGPLLLAWMRPSVRKYVRYFCVLGLLSLVSAFMTAVVFQLIDVDRLFFSILILLLPVTMITMINYGQRVVFTIQVVVAFVAIIATANGNGPFAQQSEHASLLELQVFIAIFSLVISVIALLTAERQSAHDELEKQKIKLEKLYRSDALTGLPNRYRIEEFLNIELQHFRNLNQKFAVVLLDIDDFKNINDNYGHISGDKILVAMCNLITTNIREADLFGRWGGEEFILILRHCDEQKLDNMCEKLRQLVASTVLLDNHRISISLGASIIKENDSELSLLQRADEALYLSKNAGKNQFTIV